MKAAGLAPATAIPLGLALGLMVGGVWCQRLATSPVGAPDVPFHRVLSAADARDRAPLVATPDLLVAAPVGSDRAPLVAAPDLPDLSDRAPLVAAPEENAENAENAPH